MTTFVAGASGATGRLLVEELLHRGESVRAIVRTGSDLPAPIENHEKLFITRARILGLGDDELRRHVEDCHAVASCLGHHLTFKGLYGHPRRLVTDAARRLCSAIKANQPERPVKFVLMNTAGNRNRDLAEPISLGERCILLLLRLLLPPHSDNEQAADFLRTAVGPDDPDIEWAAVRPDRLVDGDNVTQYEIHPSPIRSAVFNAGTTSRINVARFMAELITDPDTWRKWKGKMPVIYNKG